MVTDRFLVGRFGAPHGIGGEIRLSSFTENPRAIASYKPLLDESGKREFSILHLRALKDNMFVVRIGGVCDRASAGALTNTALYVPRASLPETGEDAFYLADLIGLEVVTATGEPFGRITNVLNFGGGDILELARARSDEVLLLPFKKDIFPHVDLKAGQLTIVPPIEIEIINKWVSTEEYFQC
jgi:16S rRNA processing protein RimM